MNHVIELALFFAVVAAVVVLPGLDMAFVLGSALSGGRAHGLAAVAGIMAGGVCHVAMAVTGIALVLHAMPALETAMLLTGAAWIAWIGASLIRDGATFAATRAASRVPDGWPARRRIFARAAGTALLNPKAYLFTLAVFPQFFHPGRGETTWHVLELWIVIALTQAGVYGSIALAAGRARDAMADRPAAAKRIAQVAGAVLIAAAAWTAWRGFAG